MTSILEALNKVEEDRNASASDSDDEQPFAPEKAAETLLAAPGKKRARRVRLEFNWKPLAYAGAGLAALALVAGLSAGVALAVGGINHTAPAVVAASRVPEKAPVQALGAETYSVPAEASKPAAPEKPVTQAAPGEPAAAKAPATDVKPAAKPLPPAPAPAEPATPAPAPPKALEKAPAPAPERLAKAVSAPAPEPTVPLPTEEEIARARAASAEVENAAPESVPAPAPATTPMRTSPMSLAPGRAAERHAPLVDDISTLPRLGQNERERLGLAELHLNVLREASPSQPEGLAIINLKKVYVGEMIPGTNARLIAVHARAIAIEIEGTGERYRVMN